MITECRFVGFNTLKETVSISQVLDRYGLLVRLRRSGENLSGVCPLHQGHNPTQFRVNLANNCWICFGDCQAGGSIVDFVSRMERVGVREAGLLIQDWFQVQGGNGRPEHQHRERPERVRVVRNSALGFTLRGLDPEHPYLTQRGLSAETIRTFGLGWCQYGSLRGWIAIPIHDPDGRLVAYAGRWPGDPLAGEPKYRLPRGFRKSLELFNQHRAPAGTEPLVVVEGFFGCMAIWQAGFRRVVSLMGSMLSEAQESRIATIAPHGVVLMFDSDEAGRRGASETRHRLSRHLRVSAIHLPEETPQPELVPPGQLMALIRGEAS